MKACGCSCGKPWEGCLKGRGGWQDQLFARMMKRGAKKYNQLLDTRKKELFECIQHGSGIVDLLEVGLGTGPNFQYYNQNKVRECGGFRCTEDVFSL